VISFKITLFNIPVNSVINNFRIHLLYSHIWLSVISIFRDNNYLSIYFFIPILFWNVCSLQKNICCVEYYLFSEKQHSKGRRAIPPYHYTLCIRAGKVRQQSIIICVYNIYWGLIISPQYFFGVSSDHIFNVNICS